MTPIRWGIAGPGHIADVVAGDFAHVDGAELVAVGSRALDRAEGFAARHGLPRAHGSYAALVEDPEVDVVYVATPHPQHHAIALGAIRAGKAVLVEKAFTATLAGTREVVAAARERGVFAMEAMWTRFHPAVVRARELIAGGAIGDVVAIHADLAIAPPYDPASRLFAPELGGGALLDLGVYPVSFAQMILGAPSSVEAAGTLAPTGVEASATIELAWPRHATARLTTSLLNAEPPTARIHGREGWIEVGPPFHHATSLTRERRGGAPGREDLPLTGAGYAHELAEVTACVRDGRTESAVMPLDDTIAVMAILEAAATQLGVSWREDPDAYRPS